MKRILIALLLGVVMVFTVGCGEDEDVSDGMDYWNDDSEYTDSYDGGSDYDSDYDDWDTDDNGTADWNDVDTNNDGDVSADEFDDYLDDWEEEMNYQARKYIFMPFAEDRGSTYDEEDHNNCFYIKPCIRTRIMWIIRWFERR